MLTVRRSIGNGIEEISSDTIPELLKGGDSDLWLHFDTPTNDELQFLQNHLKIHDVTLEDIVHQNQRPKLESFDDYIYLPFTRYCAKKAGRSKPPSWICSWGTAGWSRFTTRMMSCDVAAFQFCSYFLFDL
jgi:Mg2+ and Co2+ transporter CorA